MPKLSPIRPLSLTLGLILLAPLCGCGGGDEVVSAPAGQEIVPVDEAANAASDAASANQ